MTIRQVVSTVRDSIKETNADSIYTNRFLYSLYLRGRDTLLKQDATKKDLYNTTSTFRTACIAMEPVSSLICNCNNLPYDCTVYRSKQKLPKLAHGKYGPLVQFLGTMDRSVSFTLVSPVSYTIKSKVKGNKAKLAFVFDEYLYTPDTTYPMLVLSAAFSDLVITNNCSDSVKSTNSEGCSNLLDTETGLPTYLDEAAIKNVIQLLFSTANLPNDEHPNQNKTQTQVSP